MLLVVSKERVIVCLEEKLMRIAILLAMVIVALSSNPFAHNNIASKNEGPGNINTYETPTKSSGPKITPRNAAVTFHRVEAQAQSANPSETFGE
jgi:hypothetical protein